MSFVPVMLFWSNQKSHILFGLGVLISVQLIINPFYTERIEAGDLGTSTFSLSIFKVQIIGYMKGIISHKGFLAFLPLALMVKLRKKSLIFLAVWIGFILLYASHYRSIYIVTGGDFQVFDSYRYLVNCSPLFIGAILGSLKSFDVPNFAKYYIGLTSMVSLVFSLYQLNHMTKDEYAKYHIQQSEIRSHNKASIILDSQSLVSRLHFIADPEYSVLSLNEQNFRSHLNKGSDFYIIDRFNWFSINADYWKDEYYIYKLESLGLYYFMSKNKNKSHGLF